MDKLWRMIIIFCFYVSLSSPLLAEDISITGKEIIERLVRLEEGQASLNKRIDGLENNLNKRTDDLDNSLNKRIDGLDKRVDDLDKKIDGLDNSLNRRIDDLDNGLNRRIDDLDRSLNRRIGEIREFILWGFALTFSGMFILVGFILWDRRSTLSPVITSMKDAETTIHELKKREKMVEDVLTEYSKDNPSLASLLKKKGIL